MNLEKQCVSSRENVANHGRGRRRSFLTLACLALVGIATWSLSLPSPAAAQAAAADPALAGLQVWNTHNCSMCHSGMGTGTKGEFAAPNLRESTLKAADIRETVACGRGAMPTHLEGAYKTVACYGMPLGAVPNGQAVGVQMSAADLDTLVGFLVKYVINVPLTKDICALYNGGDVRFCGQYP
jgi:cbb3-type cytochrome c oxidase subunit III